MAIEKWTDTLPADVYQRLCNCCTIKADLPALVDAKWAAYKRSGKDRLGYSKGDALISLLELLDENGCDFELTHDDFVWLCE